MTRAFVTIVLFAALAACGSKSPPPAKPTDPTPIVGGGSATAEGSAAGSANDPMGERKPVVPDKAVPDKAVPPKPDPEKVKADLLAAENAAYEKAKPVFAKSCANCHTKSGKKATAKKLAHFDMATYPFGGEHTKSIGNEIRKVLGIDGAKATMPFDKPGSVKGDDLALIKAWTEAWQAAGKGGVHPADPADKDD